MKNENGENAESSYINGKLKCKDCGKIYIQKREAIVSTKISIRRNSNVKYVCTVLKPKLLLTTTKRMWNVKEKLNRNQRMPEKFSEKIKQEKNENDMKNEILWPNLLKQ